jgi:hypothetical protein
MPLVFQTQQVGSQKATTRLPPDVLLDCLQPLDQLTNGMKNSLTIFICISFCLISNENKKVRNKIRSVKFDPSKTDKFKQKYLSIDW